MVGPRLLFGKPRSWISGMHHSVSPGDARRYCYDVEVGENRVRVFYGIAKREGERLVVVVVV